MKPGFQCFCDQHFVMFSNTWFPYRFLHLSFFWFRFHKWPNSHQMPEEHVASNRPLHFPQASIGISILFSLPSKTNSVSELIATEICETVNFLNAFLLISTSLSFAPRTCLTSSRPWCQCAQLEYYRPLACAWVRLSLFHRDVVARLGWSRQVRLSSRCTWLRIRSLYL